MGILIEYITKCLQNNENPDTQMNVLSGSTLSRNEIKNNNISNNNTNIQNEMENDKKIFDIINEMRKNPDTRKAENYNNISAYFEKAEEIIKTKKIKDLKWEDNIYKKIRQCLINNNDNKLNYDNIFKKISEENKNQPIKNKLYGQCEYSKKDKHNKDEEIKEEEHKAYKYLEKNPNDVLNVLTINYSNLIIITIPKKNNNDLVTIYYFFYDI